MKDTNEDIWLTPQQLFETFGIKLGTQARLRSDKKIPFSKIGNIIRYSQAKIHKWFSQAHQKQPQTNNLKDPN